MLIGEVITEIIKQVGADPDDLDTRDKMLLCLKSALRKFPLFARTRAIKDTAHAQLNTGDYYINPLPADFFEEDVVYFIENNVRKFIDVDEQRFRNDVGAGDFGTPKFCRVIGETLEFNCKSDKARVIYVEYFKEIDNVVETDSWAFDSNMLEVAKDGAKYYYYSDYTEDQAKGKEKLALFSSGIDKLEERHMIKMCGGHIEDSED